LKNRVFLSIKTIVLAGLLFSLVITICLAKIYIEHETEKKLYQSFEKQREEISSNIAKALIEPLKTFAPSDASSALEIIKQDSKIVKIQVHDMMLDTTFINIYIPDRDRGLLYKNKQKIYNDKKEELGWIEITFNALEIQNQIDEINKIINIILIFASIVFVLIMTTLLYFKVFSPLKRLFAQAQDFQNNNFETSYVWKTSDELSLVGKNFEEARISIFHLLKELAQKNRELEELYVTDKLTNLYNRHKLDIELKNQENMFERYNQTFGAVILDIDDFKSINDTYGHLRGDKVLIDMALILKNSVRKTDIVGRWGGEEFLIIVPQTDEKDLVTLSKKLQECIANYDFGLSKQVTASFGLSLYKESLELLLKNADEALYQIKNSGKNSICFFS
jgi:diguanylate cyclase (GGDEF)-like protein